MKNSVVSNDFNIRIIGVSHNANLQRLEEAFRFYLKSWKLINDDLTSFQILNIKKSIID